MRIGQGRNMTGDQSGVAMQVTGTQYLGKETGFNPREGGVKVSATRTAAGLVVTGGTRLRSKIMITGDESNGSIRITGEAEQEIADDLLNHTEQGAYTSMQFQRQNIHGRRCRHQSRPLDQVDQGSADRDTAPARHRAEANSGLPISGTAVGRSVLMSPAMNPARAGPSPATST
ncbi:MAG: CsoS2 family carboxysome shell protein [Chromatiales bacterium]|nr:CsoS2 family carboxysome shell protein [Chromatiales bacterium]